MSSPFDLLEVLDSLEALDEVLKHNDVNRKDKYGNTLLITSLNQNRSDEFIIRLLNAKADPNVQNICGDSALLTSLRRSTLTIAQELINKGANINTRNKSGETALYAVINYLGYNPEAVSFLLYYGADVNVKVKEETAISRSFIRGNIDESQILLNYYDGGLDDILYNAIRCDGSVAYKSVEMGANVNYVCPKGENMLELALNEGNVALFKLIWERFDYRIILEDEKSFLVSFFCSGNFLIASNDLIDILNLMLNSSVALELAQQCDGNFFSTFTKVCCEGNNVPLSDRLRIIFLALSLGTKVNLNDVLVSYDVFGFNEELGALIYFVDYEDVKWNHYDSAIHLLSFILGEVDDLKDINPCRYNRLLTSFQKPKNLGYFNRSCYNRFFPNPSAELSERLQRIPDFPTLLELSRTPSRQFVREAYGVKKPFQFHDAIKELNLPRYVEDVIRFKVPIYL